MIRLPLHWAALGVFGLCTFTLFTSNNFAQILPNEGPEPHDTLEVFIKKLPTGDTAFVTMDKFRNYLYDFVEDDGSCDSSIASERPTWRSRLPINDEQVGVMFTGVPCPTSVGINTSFPQGIIDVESTFQTRQMPAIKASAFNFTTPVLELGLKRQTTPALRVYGNGQLHIQMPASVSDNRAVRISDASGLDVYRVLNSGTVYATEYYAMLKTDFPTYPDYVFGEAYELMPLSALKSFIEEHKHLPNIPSAQEMHEEGVVNLGEMNRLYLEKIEELTLYILQLEERISDLEKAK